MVPAADIAVVYLARKAEGIEPIKRFVASYLARDAGEPHKLVVVFKGFNNTDSQFAAVLDVLDAIEYQSFHMDDFGIDISAYLRAAEKLDHRSICFLNTFVEIADDGWLAKFVSNLRRPGVGLVGATGSYESLHSSFYLLMKASWLCFAMKVAYDSNLASHYGFWIKHHAPAWLANLPDLNLSVRVRRRWNSFRDYVNYNKRYQDYWPTFAGSGAPGEWLSQFPRFPNPHIRSNAFMIDRQRVLDFASPKVISKEDGCRFESGPRSLTTYVRSLGLSTLVVGKDGNGYNIESWPLSRTFRLGNQDNILVADNQVRAFKDYSPEIRAIHVFMTWGDYVRQDAVSFPALGMKFHRSMDPL
jgi:hypothetical protein